MNDEHDNPDFDFAGAIDEKQAMADIARGAKALRDVQKTAGKNWMEYWSPAVRGWRGLREMAFKRSGTRDLSSQAYRDQMNHLLSTVDGNEYRSIAKETRAAMTRLVDHIDAIDVWLAGQPWEKRDRWQNPQTIVKHVPKHLLSRHGRNLPPRKPKAKVKSSSGEENWLRQILIEFIQAFLSDALTKEKATEMLGRLYQGDPDDSIDDLGVGDDESEEGDED